VYAISANHHQRCVFEPRSGELYSKQHYVIKCVSDLRQVGGYLRVLWIQVGWLMVFNTTFNNISVISWQSVLLEEESRVHVDNHRPVASH
jgi:hypothetical protein